MAATASIAAHQTSLTRALRSCFHPWLLKSPPPFRQQAAISGVSCKRLQRSVAVAIHTAHTAKWVLPFYCFNGQPRLSPTVASLGQAGPLAGFATEVAENEQRASVTDPVVSVDWLQKHLGDPNIKVLDASWYMPNDKRDPFQEYKMCHIPGAIFFDVDGIVDPSSHLPHMLPSETAFAAAVSSLGIRNSDTVIVYDGKGIFSAARVWWMFQAFGHQNVMVLDGGLPHWRTSGFDVEESTSEEILGCIQSASASVKKVHQGQQVGAPAFKATFQSDRVWSLEQVKRNIEEKKYQLVDARSKARFDGVIPEPRKGIRGGHVPGSKCVPFNEVLKDGATLLGTKELEGKFKEAGVSLSSPIVASCGTGVTACVLALAFHRLGKRDVAVYDGSWTEWGGLPDTPIVTKAAT